jgi:SNF2 family DNA or RNA helicase
MERKFFMEWGGSEFEAVSAGSKSMKCRQIASGAVYHEPGDPSYEKIHDAKIEALQDIVAEANGTPVLVGYYFQSSLERILASVPGAVYFDDSPRTLDRFIRGEIPVLLAHPKSAGHGVDGMQEQCYTCVFFDLDWNLEEHEQLIERIGPTRQVQSGHRRTVFVHYLLAEGTLDAEMVERLETKASVQDSVKLAMKRRGL